MKPSRRRVIGGGAGAIAALATSLFAPRWFGKHYPPTPYDDLLALLDDREAAKKLGRAFLAAHPNFTASKAAHALRDHIGKRQLATVLQNEIVNGQLTEAGHWAVPQTLAGICALAART